MLLWDILFRGQLGFSVSFLEEMWSRNMANLMMSPLRPSEFILSLMAMSLIRLAIGMVPVSFLAILFFGFNLWGLGLALAAFFRQSAFHELVDRAFMLRPRLASWSRGGKPRLDHHVSPAAPGLRLLSRHNVAELAARFRLAAAADLCL
jgi:hypothetical protein